MLQLIRRLDQLERPRPHLIRHFLQLIRGSDHLILLSDQLRRLPDQLERHSDPLERLTSKEANLEYMIHELAYYLFYQFVHSYSISTDSPTIVISES